MCAFFQAILWPLLLVQLCEGQQKVMIPVKRVHSRQRRFIAPGAVWDILIGCELIGSDFELRYNLVVHYRKFYLLLSTPYQNYLC